MKHKKDTAPTGGQMALFSAEAFHANHIHSQANDSVKRMNAICGPRCVELFAKLSPTGSWARMFSALLTSRTDWYSTRCRLTWKLKGTKYKRLYFQLAPQTLRTDVTEFGLLQSLLKTPCAADAYADSLSKKEQRMGNSGTLAQEIATGFVYQRGLLPTPRATKISGTDREDFGPSLPGLMNKGLLPTPRTSDKNSPGIHGNGGQDLRTVVAMQAGMMPTPTTRDYKGARSTEALEAAGRNETNSLSDFFAQTGKTSQLNPRFVLEMMGFPPNWTELPFLNGETKASKPQETP